MVQKKYFLVLLTSFFILISCKKEKQKIKEEREVNVKTTFTSLTKIDMPVSEFSHLPRLVVSNEKLHMTWVEKKDSLAILKYSCYNKNKWSGTKIISSGKDWFVNWADFPALAVNGDNMLTNILKKSAPGTYDYDIFLSLFSPNEIKISNFLLNKDKVASEHGFVSMKAYDDGYYVSWLDGRKTKNKDLRKREMTLRNAFINLDGKIVNEVELDNRVCDCCNTATAISNNGPVVVYRDRSNDNEEVRDISIVRWIDGEWTKPKPIHSDYWKLNGCPVNGPALATKGSNVAVAWFTAQNETPRILLAFSNNNGEKFNKPIRIDSANAIGRVDVSFLKDNSALVSWLEPIEENVVLQVARVHKNGSKDENMVIANTLASRQSGFPQLEVINDTVYVAWTDLNEDPKIKMVSYKVQF